jgi:hypothetical protein
LNYLAGEVLVERQAFTVKADQAVSMLKFVNYSTLRRPPYCRDYENFDEVPLYVLVTAIRDLLAAEGPIHLEYLFKQITSFFGLKRAGQQIRGRIERLLASPEVTVQGSFVWITGSNVVPRRRAALTPDLKKSEYVADNELTIAIIEVVNHFQPIFSEEVQQQVWEALGFQRVSGEMKSRAHTCIEKLLETRRLTIKNGNLSVT